MKSSGSFRKRSRRSRGIRRRIAAAFVLLGLVALGVWAVARYRGGANAGAAALAADVPAPAPLATSAPWSPAEIARADRLLREAFAPALAGADGWSLAVLGAAGENLYDDRARTAVAPASTLKLLVASAALADLGPRFRYVTIFAARTTPGSDGTLAGDLWLAGSGDPSLRTPDLARGVDALARMGLARIDGGVAVDATAIAGPEINPHWNPDDANEDFQAPVSGISLDGDTVEFDVSATAPGAGAEVRVVPDSDAVSSSGSIATSNDEDSVTIVPGAAPNSFVLDGAVPEGSTERFWVPVHGIAQYAGAVLERLLKDRGIATGAPPAVAAAPLGTVELWEHRSAPLRALEAHMLFLSDNHYAEQLLRTLGRETGGEPDDAAGIAAERRFLNDRGIPAPGLTLVDGSGLAAGDRIAAITLAGILQDAQRRGGDASLYLLLPQGGRQGTLRYYDFTTAAGRVRAKSGHISGVSALAGYVDTEHHGRVVFAFSVNGSPGDPDAAIVRALNRLATL